MRNYKIFLICVLIIAAGGLTTYYAYTTQRKATVYQQQVTEQKPETWQKEKIKQEDADQVGPGVETIKFIPGVKPILLADHETQIVGYFPKLPYVLFGTTPSMNDIHNINYLPLSKEISFYNKGYFISLENKGCNYEVRHTDVPEYWTTDCTIHISTTKAEPPVLKIQPIVAEINIENRKKPKTVSTKPLVVVSLDSGNFGVWDTTFITSYGIDTLRYTNEEFAAKQKKELTIGPLKINSEVVLIDKFNIAFRYAFSGIAGSIRLASYSE